MIPTGLDIPTLRLRRAPSPRHSTRGPQRSQSLEEEEVSTCPELASTVLTSELRGYAPVLEGITLGSICDRLI